MEVGATVLQTFSVPTAPGSRVMTCYDDVANIQVACSMEAQFVFDEGRLVKTALDDGDYVTLDGIFLRWCSGKDRFADGTWKLEKYAESLFEMSSRLPQWEGELKKVIAWQQVKPESVAAIYAEVVLRRAYAWSIQTHAHGGHTSKESREIFNERIEKAYLALQKIPEKSMSCPAWYPIRIAQLSDEHKPAQARKVFEHGVRLHPEYHAIYMAMASVQRPSLGGSVTQYEAFANESVRLANRFEGKGMYARVYSLVDNTAEIPFLPEKASFPDWKKLRAGFEDLMKKNPYSYRIMNTYAAVACRSGDGRLYRRLRGMIRGNVYEHMYHVIPLESCDRRHNWRPDPRDPVTN